MTRKDYILIADALKAAKPIPAHQLPDYSERAAIESHRNAVHSICAALSDDNPRFDRERFLKACGL